MSDVTIVVNGVPRRVPGDVTLAIALIQLHRPVFRRDSAGSPRGPLCAIGTCFECAVSVNGADGVRSCQLPVQDGMTVEVAE